MLLFQKMIEKLVIFDNKMIVINLLDRAEVEC
ncbi:hypothetical protein EDC19_1784 [Natranaerovirga hydrolytica]|uniref:Uncharacterized protein n=1 Tax=Natranaerovirga hydrolytica TaxID=680378 RepID=A0A4R1MRU5_9FIRM|nr:hypothetical protein EDC19_1784 [Natranaerovirga hydrolytica]